MKKVVAVILLVSLSGFAQTVWNKPGVSQTEFNLDKYNCEKDARQSGYFGGGLVGAINMQNFAEQCMTAHGYTKMVQN